MEDAWIFPCKMCNLQHCSEDFMFRTSQEFVCGICNFRFNLAERRPVSISACGHFACQSCISKILNDPDLPDSCYMCRAKFDKDGVTPSYALKRMIPILEAYQSKVLAGMQFSKVDGGLYCSGCMPSLGKSVAKLREDLLAKKEKIRKSCEEFAPFSSKMDKFMTLVKLFETDKEDMLSATRQMFAEINSLEFTLETDKMKKVTEAKDSRANLKRTCLEISDIVSSIDAPNINHPATNNTNSEHLQNVLKDSKIVSGVNRAAQKYTQKLSHFSVTKLPTLEAVEETRRKVKSTGKLIDSVKECIEHTLRMLDGLEVVGRYSLTELPSTSLGDCLCKETELAPACSGIPSRKRRRAEEDTVFNLDSDEEELPFVAF